MPFTQNTYTMKRFSSLLLSTLFAVSLLAQPFDKCGVWRWDIKTLTDSEGPALLSLTPEHTTITELNQLTRPEHVGTNDPRFDDEKRLVTVTGKIIAHKRLSGDGDHDYHIVVQSPDGSTQLIAEIPSPDCPEIFGDSVLHEFFTELRGNYVDLFGTPTTSLKQLEPVEVEITGVPFWDMSAHGSGHSENGIEIHPVTGIHPVNLQSALESDFDLLGEAAASASSTTATPKDFLMIILLGGLLGMVGQLLRVVIGIKKALDKGQEMDYKRLILSLFLSFAIGMVAGVLAALNVLGSETIDKTTVVAFLAAGYAGTDFIEGFMRK